MDYRERVFQQVLTLLEEEDWSHTCVPLEPCCHRMASLEPRCSTDGIIMQMHKSFSPGKIITTSIRCWTDVMSVRAKFQLCMWSDTMQK